MGRVSNYAKRKTVESFHKHPRPWLAIAGAGILTLGGTVVSAEQGDFNRFMPHAGAEAGVHPVSDTRQAPAAHEKQHASAKDTLGHISCATTVQGGNKPVLSVTITKGHLPADVIGGVSVTYSAQYDGDDRLHYGGGDRGDLSFDIKRHHGSNIVTEATATLTAHGKNQQCTPWHMDGSTAGNVASMGATDWQPQPGANLIPQHTASVA